MDAQSGDSFQKAPRGTLKRLRKKATNQAERRMQAWRDAVWNREQIGVYPEQWALCQHCRCYVCRVGIGGRGEVDHIKPRSTCSLSERYDPANGQLLCPTCHRKKHG